MRAAALVAFLFLAATARAEDSPSPAQLVGEIQTLQGWRLSSDAATAPLPSEIPSAPAPPNKLPGPAVGDVIDGLAVSGTPDFIRKTKSALELLKKTSKYARIRADLGAISEGRCSGMWVYAAKPTYYAGRATWSGDLIWYAGTIAHDSMHAELYAAEKKRLNGAEPPASAWTGAQAEKICMQYQLGVVEELGASKKTRDYLAKLIAPTPQNPDGPVYQNIGAGKADVCAERNW